MILPFIIFIEKTAEKTNIFCNVLYKLVIETVEICRTVLVNTHVDVTVVLNKYNKYMS